MYTSSSSPSSFLELIEKSKRDGCKKETPQKLVGFFWEFYHFHGNDPCNLAISKILKIPPLSENSTKKLGNFMNL